MGCSLALIVAVFCSEAGVHLYSGREFLGAGGDLSLTQPAFQAGGCACLSSASRSCILLSSRGRWPEERGCGVPAETQSQLTAH